MIDAYHKYNFEYNEKKFMSNFKKVIVSKGYNSLSLFHELIKPFGVTSYETARSYYNKRRIIPVDILIKIANKLNLDITELMFPDSIPLFEYKENLATTHEDYYNTFNLFNTVFYLNNPAINKEILPSDSVEKEKIYLEMKCAAKQLAIVISKFNYLLQKYIFSGLNLDEFYDFSMFTINLIADRNTNIWLNNSDIIELKNNLNSIDVLDKFYEKYTFSFRELNCIKLLDMMKKDLPQDLFKLINNLLPEVDIME